MLTEIVKTLRPLWHLMLLSTVMGGISGLSIAGLLAVANKALYAGPGTTGALVLAFFGLCLLALVGDVVSDIVLNIIGQRLVADLRQNLCAKILYAPIAQIEMQKAPRLIAALHEDVAAITTLFLSVPRVVISVPIILGCLVYLALLSAKILLLVLAVIVAGVALHTLATQRARRAFRAARDVVDHLQKHYRAISEGAKELRINRDRRARFFGTQLRQTLDGVRTLTVRANNIHATADAAGSLLFFVLIGVMLALLNYDSQVDKSVISGFILVLLYMRGPIAQVVGILPVVGNAQVSFAKIRELEGQLAESEPHLGVAHQRFAYRHFSSIELRDICYTYVAAAGAEPFELGPVNLSINAGETLFMTGGNGSGKTTLIKLLLGLYYPAAGQILLDGQPVGSATLDDYRQLFSVVFTDYYLFEDLMPGESMDPAEVQRYLEQLGIGEKVNIADGLFSSTDLSTGQRKRLALIHAYAEARPVLVFDEWAADQDPSFRRIFYTELLPELKRKGKTIIAITHDDRYFDVADRCIKLDAGQVVEDARLAPVSLHTQPPSLKS
jgi:putative pyoverdin transport system ATP-binding/permease protein